MHMILPPTGTVGAFYVAIRKDSRFVCEVKAATPDQATKKAADLAFKIDIADLVLQTCSQSCSPDRHVPNCPVHDARGI